jgi:hypothetical protein
LQRQPGLGVGTLASILGQMPPDAAKRMTYHHATYLRASVDALAGDADSSVRWLNETVTRGMPVYPAFARDSCFDRVRGSVPFGRFMTGLKPVWDEYARKMQ